VDNLLDNELIMKKEFVYFIKLNPNINTGFNQFNYVKIGKSYSIDGIKRRISGLQVGSPFKLEFLGYMEGSEKYFHDYFDAARVQGEWFIYNTIAAKINSYNLIRFNEPVKQKKYIPFVLNNGKLKETKIIPFLTRAFKKLFILYDVELKTRKEITDDYFGNTINPGDRYFNIKDNPYQWNGIYLTITNAYKFYCMFKSMVNMRNTKFYYDKRHIDVKESLKELKEIWQDEFKDIIFDEKKGEIVKLYDR
jgi:hypothetical protein